MSRYLVERYTIAYHRYYIWSLLKSELPKLNRASIQLDDVLLVDALTAAEYRFYDTIRIKIGYDKGYEFGLLYN